MALKTTQEEITAMTFGHAPGAPNAAPEKMASFGMAEIAVLHAGAACNRMLPSVKELEARRTVGLGGRESWYLNNMVVGAAQRGAGVKTRILLQRFEQVADPSGRLDSLTIQGPENVTFYQRLRFVVTHDNRACADAASLRNRIMVYW